MQQIYKRDKNKNFFTRNFQKSMRFFVLDFQCHKFYYKQNQASSDFKFICSFNQILGIRILSANRNASTGATSHRGSVYDKENHGNGKDLVVPDMLNNQSNSTRETAELASSKDATNNNKGPEQTKDNNPPSPVKDQPKEDEPED